jgi:hypothetical protein
VWNTWQFVLPGYLFKVQVHLPLSLFPTDSVVLTAFIQPNSVPYIELFSSHGGRLDNVASCVQIQ